MNLLELRNILLRFGGLTAVNGVDLAVGKGEIVSVIGPNGAGKTSLFNVMTGLYKPNGGVMTKDGAPVRAPFTALIALKTLAVGLVTGLGLALMINAQSMFQSEIIDRYVYQQPFPWRDAFFGSIDYVRGAPLSDTAAPFLLGLFCGSLGAAVSWRRARFGPEAVSRFGLSRTFQNIRLFKDLTVLDNVLVALEVKHATTLFDCALMLPLLKREQGRNVARAREILAFVGLDEVRNLEAASLSYGDQRRLEIARALGTDPAIVLLDEPAAGMNPTEAASLMELIRQIRERGITVILIEHHMKVVMEISDRVAVLDYGNKIAEGTPQQVCADPRVIEAYLGKGSPQ